MGGRCESPKFDLLAPAEIAFDETTDCADLTDA
jgi:hypothetical protein